MDWKYLFTSFEGRIGRQQMWMGIIVLMVVSLVANVLDMLFGTIDVESGIGIIGGLFALVSIYPAVALYAKRWHDRGKSGLVDAHPLRAADRFHLVAGRVRLPARHGRPQPVRA